MDSHLIVKVLHASFAVLAFIGLLLRAYPLWAHGNWQAKSSSQENWQENRTTSNKILVGLQHLSYSILVLSGVWLLWSNQFVVQTWFYAKVILFLVILSASTKAFKRNPEILLVQRQAGLVISTIAFCALFGLVMLKPHFG